MAGDQLLEGTAEHYRRFLSETSHASLINISDNFNFKIRAIETPSLVLREVNTHGQAVNRNQYGDAFFALMLSHGPGHFSTGSELPPLSSKPHGPSLHWHWPNELGFSQHLNSQVTYLRLESAGLLRQLAIQQIGVDQLHNLQGSAATPGMVQLISSLRHRLIISNDASARQRIVDDFLTALGQQLRSLLLQPGQANSSTARHVEAAIRWLDDHLAEAITLPRLAAELGLTPRAVQACFRNRLGLSPMRWLKLARFSKLRQLLHDPGHRHRSSQQLKTLVGLSSNSLNRQTYREIYGLTLAEDQQQAQLEDQGGVDLSSDDHFLHFNSIDTAIAGLQAIQPSLTDQAEPAPVSITITITTAPSLDGSFSQA